MLHEPAQDQGEDLAASYKMRLGVYMFFIYAAVYAGFIIINVVQPTLMAEEVLFGMNLAVVYGIGLIIFALVLALIYNSMCGKREQQLAEGAEKNEEGK